MNAQTLHPQQEIRRLSRLGCAMLGLGLGGMASWGAGTQVAGAVIANGTVVMESSTKKVQHLNGGIVGEILVTEGSQVMAGQVLLRLDDTLTRATLGVIRSQLDLLVAREARLLVERDGVDAIGVAVADGESSESAISGERRLFQSRRDGLAAQRGQLRERISQTREEITGLAAQRQSKDGELGYIAEELSSVTELYGKSLVSLARLKQLQRDQARLQGERGQLVADIARSRGKVAETEIQLLQLDQDFRTEVLKDLRETQAKIAELRERESAALDELKHIDIRSPQAGTVYQLQVHTVGGVVGKGETIMQIAPRADDLIVEAKVSPQDIDQVAAGAPVRVKINSGNRRTTPDRDGTVTVVSPDLVHDSPQPPAPGSAYYTVRVGLAPTGTGTGDLQLMAGMPAEIYIRTEDRTPLDYLLKPLQEQFARTFRER